MKSYKIIILLFALTAMAFAGKKTIRQSREQHLTLSDTMPDICAVITAQEIDALHIFSNPLTKVYTEPDPVERFNACYYEFYKPNDYPSLSVQLTKCLTKREAADIYNEHVHRDHEFWGSAPERILRVADSVCFTQHANCQDKCAEAVLVVVQGIYVIWVNMRPGGNGISRDWLKLNALKIVQMMFDRIPGLAPQMIRNKQ